jgi:hypothetical protein
LLARNLFLDFIVNLPEEHRARGGFRGWLALIVAGELQHWLGDRLFERPVAKDRFDREPAQSG